MEEGFVKEMSLVLSLEWKVEAVIGDESEGGDCDGVICAEWGEPGVQWTVDTQLHWSQFYHSLVADLHQMTASHVGVQEKSRAVGVGAVQIQDEDSQYGETAIDVVSNKKPGCR